MEKHSTDTIPDEPVPEPVKPQPAEPSPEPKTVAKAAAKNPAQPNGWDTGRIFWGLLLILIGALSLLSTFGVVDVNWSNIWQLWPLAIVAAGLSVLSLRGWTGRIITFAFVIITLVAVAMFAVGQDPGSSSVRTDKVSLSQSSSSVEQAEVSIKTGASTLNINTANQKEIVKATYDSSTAKISQTSVQQGSTQRISLASEGTRQWWKGDFKSTWDVLLTRSLPLSLIADVGASDAKIDVADAQLRSLKIKSGASSIDLKLGAKFATISVDLNAGASSVVIRAPKDSGIRLKLTNGLSSQQYGDLADVGDGTFETPGYAAAANKINITGNVGVSSITIERY